MLTLIIDADDTLWENNIYYEACVTDFAALMAEEGFDPQEAKRTLDAVESERIPQVGYAPQEFARSMVITYERLCQRHHQPVREEVAETALQIGRRVLSYPMVPLDGVEGTLERLSSRCRMILLTKGDRAVQEEKLARSGLGRFFDEVHVVMEKDAAVFRKLIERHSLDRERTWMVGNSPRSDINPAVEAGIGAVYVPHDETWDLEIEEIAASDRITVLERFQELDSFLSGIESREEEAS